MKTAAVRMARGNVRLASTISSPIVDAFSTPAKAKAIVDQKITSLRPVLGISDCRVMGVADPYFIQEKNPNASSRHSGTHAASAPTFVSHLPMFRPTTLSATAAVRPNTDTARKYVLLVESAWTDGPPMNSALAAAKYNSPGKYGRLDDQYVHPVIKAANGPKARLLQTYM